LTVLGEAILVYSGQIERTGRRQRYVFANKTVLIHSWETHEQSRIWLKEKITFWHSTSITQ